MSNEYALRRLLVALLGVLALAGTVGARAGVIFSTAPPNASNTGAVLRNGGVPVNVEVADDLKVTERGFLERLVFWTVGEIPVAEFTYRLWSDASGSPGGVLGEWTVSDPTITDLGGSGVFAQKQWVADVEPYEILPDVTYWLSLLIPSSASGVYGWQYTGGPGFGSNAVGGARPGTGFSTPFGGSAAFELIQLVPVPAPTILLLAGFVGLRAARSMRLRTGWAVLLPSGRLDRSGRGCRRSREVSREMPTYWESRSKIGRSGP
jgi:hypothetical protein